MSGEEDVQGLTTEYAELMDEAASNTRNKPIAYSLPSQ